MVFDPRSLLRASFNGIPFWVESGGPEAGHRVNVTTIPNGAHINESFGVAPRKYEIEAYCSGDTAYVNADALLLAAENKHQGLLVLPWGVPVLVRMSKAHQSFDRKKLGFITVSLEAVNEPTPGRGGFGANTLEQMIYAAAGVVQAALGVFAALRFLSIPAGFGDVARQAALLPLARLDDIALQCRLDPAAGMAMEPLRAAVLVALDDFALRPETYGAALGAYATGLGDIADPSFTLSIVDALGPPSASPPPVVSSGSAMRAAALGEAGAVLASATSALVAGEAMARRVFASRPDAVEARMITAAIFDEAIARAGRDGYDLARSLSAMSGVVTETITRRAADLAPLMTVKAAMSLPSLWWSHRLYGTPARAADLAARAKVFHPGFMPDRFTALSS